MAQSNEQGGDELRALIEEKLSEYSIHPHETHEGVCGFWGTEDGEGIDYCDCAQKFEVEQFNLCMPEIMQLILADRKQHELDAREDGQFYYLHQIKKAIATGQNVFERIDQLEAETRHKRRERLGK